MLGRYLGQSIDFVTALVAKILNSNGQVVHRYTYRVITLEEIERKSDKKQHRKFYQLVTIKIGIEASDGDFEEFGIEDMPTFEPCDNNYSYG